MIINSLPSWSKNRIADFAEHQKPPMAGAEKEPISEEDVFVTRGMVEAMISQTAGLDNTEEDLDPRLGVVSRDMGDGIDTTEYEIRGGTFESASVQGGTASYMYLDDNLTQWVSISRDTAKEPIQMAIHLDRNNPENNVAYGTD